MKTEQEQEWIEISKTELPAIRRWDVLRRDQGQASETAYAAFSAAEAGTDSPYMRCRGGGAATTYYRRAS